MPKIDFYTITFGGEKNTWDDWGLIPLNRMEFNPPEHKYSYLDIPGADGGLDLSDTLTGYPVFKPRSGSFQFRFYDNGIPVRVRYNALKNWLHGRQTTAILSEEPEFYYFGRFKVGELEYKMRWGEWADVEISYIVNPYKLEITSSLEDWLWDPFNFETGVIREYREIPVNGETIINVIGSRKPTVPRFTVSGGALTLSIGTNQYDLPVGRTVLPQIVLMDEEYEMVFNGNGTVTIDMTAGSL